MQMNCKLIDTDLSSYNRLIFSFNLQIKFKLHLLHLLHAPMDFTFLLDIILFEDNLLNLSFIALKYKFLLIRVNVV
jgi:hypothetical protein